MDNGRWLFQCGMEAAGYATAGADLPSGNGLGTGLRTTDVGFALAETKPGIVIAWPRYEWDPAQWSGDEVKPKHCFHNWAPLVESAAGVGADTCKPLELTLVIFNDAEKEIEYLDYCLRSLTLLNAEALSQTQVLILNQSRDVEALSDLVRKAKDAGLSAEVLDSGCEFVGNLPMWDVMASLRRARPHMRGRYMMIAHKEFLFAPGSLLSSVRWLLKSRQPCLALGNLLHLRGDQSARHRSCSVSEASEQVKAAMDTADRQTIVECLKSVPLTGWLGRHTARKLNTSVWVEDVFFARLDWIDCLRFFEHADRLLFQDIYDLMGFTWRELEKAGLAPPVPRMSLDVNKVYHLWHRWRYQHFCDEVIAWFASDPQRWRGTRFANIEELKRIRDMVASSKTRNWRYRFRVSPGGTVHRYIEALRRWLRSGGAARLKEFYASDGRTG
jgi:hypothetical protein